MRAYKVLSDGKSEFTQLHWPLPAGATPGQWVQASGPIGLCVNGIHACTAQQLPQWLGLDLWMIELDGEVLTTEPAIIASRGRLLGKVERWDEAVRTRFALMCLDRARRIAGDCASGPALVAKVEHTVSWGGAAPAGYFTAMLAGEAATGARGGEAYDAAVKREREAQAGWLQAELRLTY